MFVCIYVFAYVFIIGLGGSGFMRGPMSGKLIAILIDSDCRGYVYIYILQYLYLVLSLLLSFVLFFLSYKYIYYIYLYNIYYCHKYKYVSNV